jgi:RHS repeat-associated protein
MSRVSWNGHRTRQVGILAVVAVCLLGVLAQARDIAVAQVSTTEAWGLTVAGPTGQAIEAATIDGPTSVARFAGITDLHFEDSGDLLVAAGSLRRISGGLVSTIPINLASDQYTLILESDSNGNIYFVKSIPGLNPGQVSFKGIWRRSPGGAIDPLPVVPRRVPNQNPNPPAFQNYTVMADGTVFAAVEDDCNICQGGSSQIFRLSPGSSTWTYILTDLGVRRLESDNAGNAYVFKNNSVWKWSPNGQYTQLPGLPTWPALKEGVTNRAAAQVFYADTQSSFDPGVRYLVYRSAAGALSRVDLSATTSCPYCDGPLSELTPAVPTLPGTIGLGKYAMALSASGDLYYATSDRVRRVELRSSVPTTTTSSTSTSTTTSTTSTTSTTTTSTSTTTTTTTSTTLPPSTRPPVPKRQMRDPKCDAMTVQCLLSKKVADPVNSSTGSFQFEHEDLATPGKGVDFSFGRSYDSQVSADGVMGPGWTHSFDQRISIDAQGAATWFRNGAELRFPAGPNGTFTAETGVVATLAARPGAGWVAVSKDQAQSLFDASGRFVSMTDRSGVGLTFAYDSAGRIVSVTDAAGRANVFAYGAAGVSKDKLIRVTTADGRLARYAYAAIAGKNRLVSYTDELAKVWSYTYDTNGNLVTMPDPNGNTEVTNTYDANSRVVSQADATGAVSTFVWNDPAGQMAFTDAAGAVTVYRTSGNVFDSATGPTGATGQQYDANLNVTSFQNENGESWSSTYDVRGNMLTRTAPTPLSYTESWTYDAQNNPTSYTDARGNTTTYSYDSAGRLLSEVKPGGVTTSNAWNADGTLATSTDPRGGVTSYTYDVNGQTLTVTTPMGFVTSYVYDTAGRVKTITNARGNAPGATATQFQTKYTYDRNGRVLTVKDELNRTNTSAYDPAGRLISQTASDGGITTYTYNQAGEVTAQTAPDGGVTTTEYSTRGERVKQTSPIGAVTTWTYDAAGRMVTMTGPRGNVAGANPADFRWTYGYDAAGRRTTVTDPPGRVTTTTFDVLGRPTVVTGPDGTRTTTYDAAGNVLSVRTPVSGDNGTAVATYDALNRNVSWVDQTGNNWSTEYDAAGNVTASIDSQANRTGYSYDADGRRTSMTSPRGFVPGAIQSQFTTTYTYDELGQQTSMTDPIGRVTSTGYDRVGNPTGQTNAKGLTTTSTYDAMNRVTKVNTPVLGATLWSYSTMGYPTSRTDSLSTAAVPRISTWAYDLSGRKIETKDAGGRRFTYGYDVAGNMTTVVDANANVANDPALGTTTMTYDRLNRLVGKDYSDATPDVTYTYNPAGRRATMTDGAGTVTYAYDSGNLLNQYTRTGPTSAGSWTFSFTNDQYGHVYSKTFPDGRAIGLNITAEGLIADMSDGSPQGYGFSRDRDGNPYVTRLPGGLLQWRTFDEAGQIVGIRNQRNAVSSETRYTRDPNGNPVNVDAFGDGPFGGSPPVSADSQRNTFDNADRLTKTCLTNTTCTGANQTIWKYDDVGSRTSEKVGTAAAALTAFDTADQSTQTSNGVTTTNDTYNANGDLVSRGADTFTYNTARQLTSATVAGQTYAYAYDGDGTRISVTGSNGTIYEITDPSTQLPTLTSERSAATGAELRLYLHADTTPLSFTDNTTGVTGYYFTDAVGSVTNIAKSDGTIVATYRYTPFGALRPNSTVSAPFANNPLKYTGQQQDRTGLYNLRARQYDPNSGRFTQTDPMPMGPGNAFESTYAYVSGNPVRYVDPSGRRKRDLLDQFCQRHRTRDDRPIWNYCAVTYNPSETSDVSSVTPETEDLTGHGIRDVLAHFGVETTDTKTIKVSKGRLWHPEGATLAVYDVQYVEVYWTSSAGIGVGIGLDGKPAIDDRSSPGPSVGIGARYKGNAKILQRTSPTRYVPVQLDPQVAPRPEFAAYDWTPALRDLGIGKWKMRESNGPYVSW